MRVPRSGVLGQVVEFERPAHVCPVWLSLILGQGFRVLRACWIEGLGCILSSVVLDTIGGLGVSGLVLGVGAATDL